MHIRLIILALTLLLTSIYSGIAADAQTQSRVVNRVRAGEAITLRTSIAAPHWRIAAQSIALLYQPYLKSTTRQIATLGNGNVKGVRAGLVTIEARNDAGEVEKFLVVVTN